MGRGRSNTVCEGEMVWDECEWYSDIEGNGCCDPECFGTEVMMVGSLRNQCLWVLICEFDM